MAVTRKVRKTRSGKRKGLGGLRRKFMAKKSQGGYTSITKQTGRPQRMLAKLRYFENGQLASGVGLFQTQLMNLNSIYDPDRSGVGHQPLGRDQWADWYNRYRVYRVDYTITLTDLDESQPAIVAVINQNGIPAYTNVAAFEQPGAYVKQLAPVGGMNKTTIKNSVYLPRLNGKTSAAYRANDDTQALFGANPAEVLTQAITVAPVIAGSPVNVGYTINYVYHVEMFDPITLPIS